MKRSLMILGNTLIVVVILLLVATYVSVDQKNVLSSRTEAFENITLAMENVTANYLIGEQQVCNSWANFINANPMSAQEAISFVRDSLTAPEYMGHLLYTDQAELSGLSTNPHAGSAQDYTVNYNHVSLFSGGFAKLFGGQSTVRVTRIFTNPINAIQSIAFCAPVSVMDEEGNTRQAELLRLIPVSILQNKWVFPTEEYENAEISLIDTAGDYIIKAHPYKNSNFYEFCSSYNNLDSAASEQLVQNITGTPGILRIADAAGTINLVAHARINSTDDWIILAMIPLSELEHTATNWTLIAIVTVGLLVLMAYNLLIVWNFNRRLKSAVDAADRANHAKTDFLSTMSHDIRTPMNAIIGLTAIAGNNVQDTAVVQESLRKIGLASNHLLTLINDILDISKVESGRLTLNPVTFSIVECAENLTNISQPMVKEKNIDFNFRISRFEHEYLYADQLRLNQIFINLLSNAIKYTEPGGKVCVEMHQTASDLPKHTRLTYIVADTGIGMTSEFMTRMYQPFSRQTDSRINAIQGTGLGLAITRQMIDLMHGSIDCQSEVGKGTTFTVTLDLPLADKQPEEMRLPPIRVLLADDDPVLLETAKDTLESIGAKTDTAKNGGEAIELLSAHPDYQVVILDWKMPDMDGIEAARQIRKKIGSAVPIVLISAYDWSDLEDAAKEASVNGFIAKPLFRSTLYNKLGELIGSENTRTEPEDEDAGLAGMRILIAEDNDINWEIISMLLSSHGVLTERAENGRAALERMSNAQEGEFDLIFMDVQMPIMNGIEATKAIRALDMPWASRIPIIAMTADAFSENVAECLAAGMNGHIAKPVDMKLVLKELKRIKEKKDAE